jgi:hypothetical protein
MRTRRVAIRWLLAKGDSRPEGGLCMRVMQMVSSPVVVNNGNNPQSLSTVIMRACSCEEEGDADALWHMDVYCALRYLPRMEMVWRHLKSGLYHTATGVPKVKLLSSSPFFFFSIQMQ